MLGFIELRCSLFVQIKDLEHSLAMQELQLREQRAQTIYLANNGFPELLLGLSSLETEKKKVVVVCLMFSF